MIPWWGIPIGAVIGGVIFGVVAWFMLHQAKTAEPAAKAKRFSPSALQLFDAHCAEEAERAKAKADYQANVRHKLIGFIDQVRNPSWPPPSVSEPHIECGSANYFTATDGYHGNAYLVIDGVKKCIGPGHYEWAIALEVLGELVDPWHGLNPPSVKQGTFTILDTEDKIREVGMWPLDWDNR